MQFRSERLAVLRLPAGATPGGKTIGTSARFAHRSPDHNLTVMHMLFSCN